MMTNDEEIYKERDPDTSEPVFIFVCLPVDTDVDGDVHIRQDGTVHSSDCDRIGCDCFRQM